MGGNGIPAPVNPPPKPKPPPNAIRRLRELTGHLDEMLVPSKREEGSEPHLTVPRVGHVTPITGGYEFRGEVFTTAGELANRMVLLWHEATYHESARTKPTTRRFELRKL